MKNKAISFLIICIIIYIFLYFINFFTIDSYGIRNMRVYFESSELNDLRNQKPVDYETLNIKISKERQEIDSIIKGLIVGKNFDSFNKRQSTKNEIDSIDLIYTECMSLYDLDILNFIKRNRTLRDALIPLGYEERIDVSFSWIGPRYETEFSYLKVFLIWLFGWYILGGLENPLLFIGLPVYIIFLLFSKSMRQENIKLLRNFYHRIVHIFKRG